MSVSRKGIRHELDCEDRASVASRHPLAPTVRTSHRRYGLGDAMRFIATDGTESRECGNQSLADSWADLGERRTERTWRVGKRPESLPEAMRIILEEAKDPYAKSYADSMDLAQKEHGAAGAKVQCAFIRANLQHWKGETARQVKLYLQKVELGEVRV